MASAFCPKCRKSSSWHGGRGERLADRRCAVCGGRLLGSTAREYQRFVLEAEAAHLATELKAYVEGDDRHAYWFSGEGWSSPARRWRGLASRVFKLWPELREVQP
jgi:hypothetical protein